MVIALGSALLLSGCPDQEKQDTSDPLGWQRVRSAVLDIEFRYPSALFELKREERGSENQFLAVSRNQPIETGSGSGTGSNPDPIPPVRVWFIMRRTSGFADRFNSKSREALTIVAGIRNKRYSRGDLELKNSQLSQLRGEQPRIWSHRLGVSVPAGALPFHYPDGLRTLNENSALDLNVQFYYLFLDKDLIEIEFISPASFDQHPRVVDLMEQTVKSIQRAGQAGSSERADAEPGAKDPLPTVNEVAGVDPVEERRAGPESGIEGGSGSGGGSGAGEGGRDGSGDGGEDGGGSEWREKGSS